MLKFLVRAPTAVVRKLPVLSVVRHTSGRSKRGLYHERDIAFGNRVSFAENRTRRSWKPNAQTKRLWSRILQCWLRFNMTTRALKCVDKLGGIDEYILFTPEKKLDSIAGFNAKKMLIAKLEEQGDSRTLREIAGPGVGSRLYNIPEEL